MTAVTPGQVGNQFNLAVQARRQPGSTFKTFVLTAAVAQGINPARATTSRRRSVPADPARAGLERVTTYDHSYVGWISVEQATLRSDNTVYAQLTLDVGPGERGRDGAPARHPVAARARALDRARHARRLAARDGVRVRDLVRGRHLLAADGDHARWSSRAARRTTDAGWGKPARKRVIPEGVAYVVTKILEENVRYGTGTAAYFGRPAAGKTGTTDNHADAWFVGYTPTLDAAVWVGYPQGEIPMTNVHGIAVSGGTFPAQIWRKFMEPALGSLAPQDWSAPKHLPTWKPFQRGKYALSYVPAYAAATDDRRPIRRRRRPGPPGDAH